MSDFLVVLCTCSNEDEGRRIGAALVEARVAACVNLLPGIHSIYRWDGNIETAAEVLLLIKTSEERFAEVRDAIAKIHSYESPEIIALPIKAGSDKYLTWLHESIERGYPESAAGNEDASRGAEASCR